ncbi:MAG: hypothetical protein M3R60_12065 [Pseudomonadota bacterium]|nr:hypothetical protein [Pseudomonadota bacterium]
MEKFLRILAVITGVVGVVISTAAFPQVPLPRGCRLPTHNELASGWRDADPNRYAIVRGDINGDGIPDQSMLLISTRQRGYALFAFISQGPHKFKT